MRKWDPFDGRRGDGGTSSGSDNAAAISISPQSSPESTRSTDPTPSARTTAPALPDRPPEPSKNPSPDSISSTTASSPIPEPSPTGVPPGASAASGGTGAAGTDPLSPPGSLQVPAPPRRSAADELSISMSSSSDQVSLSAGDPLASAGVVVPPPPPQRVEDDGLSISVSSSPGRDTGRSKLMRTPSRAGRRTSRGETPAPKGTPAKRKASAATASDARRRGEGDGDGGETTARSRTSRSGTSAGGDVPLSRPGPKSGTPTIGQQPALVPPVPALPSAAVAAETGASMGMATLGAPKVGVASPPVSVTPFGKSTTPTPMPTARGAAMPTSGSPARRLLEVDIVEAAGLLGTEKGGVSNPKVDVFLVDLAGRVVKSEGVKHTPVKSSTVSPVWNHKVTFGHRTNLSSASNNLPTLRLQVYNYQRFGAEKPLGSVDIPLMNLSADGHEWEQWYALEPFGKLTAGNRLGSIHLNLKIGPTVDSRDASSRFFAELTKRGKDTGDEDPQYSDRSPNYLKVTLHQAQDLLVADFNSSSSDPLVIFKVAGQEQRSSTKFKTLSPKWEETFHFEVSSGGDSLEVTVEDEDNFVNDFLGFVSILMGDLADKTKLRQWFDLKRKTGDLPAGEERGMVEITTQWYYHPVIAAKAKQKKTPGWNPLTDAAESETEEVVAGDYVAYVHIIEARELKGEDLQGTSDPVVYVEAFGQKFATEVVYNRLNAVFDETFVINLRNMTVDRFEEGVFRVSVMDADLSTRLGSLKADLIGAVSFDATYVYFNKDHEVHRRWVALVDDENPEDGGVQGYLHLSIAIVGPNDRLKFHDEEADRRNERAQEANGGSIDALVVMPPTLELKMQWLVTTVAKAEYLPVMDSNLVGGAGGGDFFFQSAVAGGRPIRTRKVTIAGDRHRLNPEWRTELWQPITLPCMAGNIQYSIWDWDAVGENDLAAVFYSKLRDIQRSISTQPRPVTRWVNLYGPPLHVPETRGLKELTKGGHVDYLDQYLNSPKHGSTYRGRVLIMEWIREHPPSNHAKDKVAWRRKIKMPPVPPATLYVLRVFVGSGTEIPRFVDVANFGLPKKMWIKVTVGRYSVSTEPVENAQGVCEWSQPLQLKSNFMMPMDPDQVPDVIVYLMAGTGSGAQPCSFRRFKAKDLMNEEFGGTPQWFRLKEDKVLDLLLENEFPGSVLLRLGLGPMASYAENKNKWKEEISGLLRREEYELRLHLYQARNLPAADSNGLMDPYLKIKFRGEEINTEKDVDTRRRETVDPVWYRTLRMTTKLPPKEFQAYFPQVTVQLFDWDFKWSDDYAGNLFLNLENTEILQADRRTKTLPPPPTPEWHSFYMEEPGDGQGELLVSVQLVNNPKSIDLPPPESITPKTRPAHLDMVIVGIRNMQPFQYLPMQLPYCVFEVDDMDGAKRSINTEASNKPTGRDANFLQRIKMQLELPEDVIYTPRVKIRVYDTRLGGFSIPLVGSGRIDLSKKLPWAPEYEPPLAKTFAKEGLLRAVTAHDEMDIDPDDPSSALLASDGRARPPSTSGSMRSRRSARNGAGLHFASFEDADGSLESDDLSGGGGGSDPEGDVGGGFHSGGRSGFGMGRGSRRGFNAQGTPSSVGGAGGAIGMVQEAGMSLRADNAAQLTAGGDVVDTGIGVMPALDSARQHAGDLPQSQASTPARVQAATRTFQAGRVAAAARGDDVGEDVAGIGVGPLLARTSSTNQGTALTAEVEDMWKEDYDFSGTPAYMKGREPLEGSLEEELKSTPFETYDLFRGQKLGVQFGGPVTLKVVGKLKCIVRVTEGDPDDEPLFVDKSNFESLARAKKGNDAILGELLKPKGYKVRLYVLQAINLTPMDMGLGGRPGKSDPYLKVQLGKENFDDKDNYIEDVTDADIYKCVELNCELPGAGQLQVDIMDYDIFGKDQLIGRSTIDLEDRWFDTRWQAWGLPNRCEERGEMRFQTKPLETRTLQVPTSLAPQGQLRCWLDIMSSEDARAFPPDDVSMLPARDFEVRVVFWKCKDVVAMDSLLEQNDLFVRSWVEGCDPQDTDTHWFAKKGKGSFNWRMKFKVSLGPHTQAWRFPYLTVQLWDRDLFKYNDHIAEGQLDLGPYFRKAYFLQDTVKLFPKIDPRVKDKSDETKQEEKNMEIDARRAEDSMTDNLLQREMETAPPEFDQVAAGRVSAPPEYLQVMEGGSRPTYGVDVTSSPPRGTSAPGPTSTAVSTRPESRRKKEEKKKSRGCCYWFCKCCCPCGAAMDSAPTQQGKDLDEEDKADARALINQIKNMTGLWEDDPDETYWLQVEKRNEETGRKEPMGKCLMGVQIWPMEKAELQPAGIGRNDPNSNPFLPPPAGRLRFSLNPFIMGSELLGAKNCCKVACVCCCVLSIVILVYFSSFFNFLLTLVISWT